MNSIQNSIIVNNRISFKSNVKSDTYSMWESNKNKIKDDIKTSAGIMALGTPLAAVTPATIALVEQTDFSRDTKDAIEFATAPFSIGGFVAAGSAALILSGLLIGAFYCKSADLLKKIIKK